MGFYHQAKKDMVERGHTSENCDAQQHKLGLELAATISRIYDLKHELNRAASKKKELEEKINNLQFVRICLKDDGIPPPPINPEELPDEYYKEG